MENASHSSSLNGIENFCSSTNVVQHVGDAVGFVKFHHVPAHLLQTHSGYRARAERLKIKH